MYSQLLQNKDDIKALELLENLLETASILEEYEFQNLEPEDYLKKYPNGKHVDEAEMVILEKKEDDQYEEYNYFKNHSADEYLRQYPLGQYIEEVRCFLYKGSKEYLKQYPNGRYMIDAENDITSTRLIVFCMIFFLVSIIIIVVANPK